MIALLLLGCGGIPDSDGDGAAVNVDCDDDNAAIFPGAAEVCDGIDNDCSGTIDDDPTDGETYYADSDGDGFGSPDHPRAFCDGPGEGYVGNSEDCNDSSAAASPVGEEVCDGLDNDCSGDVDDAPSDPLTFYEDSDGDGFGVLDSTTEGCTAPDGYAVVYGDCDDADADLHPEVVWYPDSDGDGYGDDSALSTPVSCEPLTGHVTDSTDCNDSDAAVNPSAAEVCDGEDTDCDGTVEADDSDDDGDGEAECEGDCDDSNPFIATTIEEDCDDSRDLDCDGRAYNSCPIGANEADFTLTGEDNYDYFGFKLAAGDVSGDGQDDLLVGAYGTDDPTSSGSLYVFFGPITASQDVDDAAIVIQGEQSYTELGVNVATGDADGDGYGDLLVMGKTAVSRGSLYLFHGPLTAGIYETAAADAHLYGENNDAFGYYTADLIDLDGDGAEEVVANTESSDWHGLVIHDSPGGNRSIALADGTLYGGESTSDAGFASAFADLSGDGILDVACGAPGESRGFIVHGPISGALDHEADAATLITGNSGTGNLVSGLVSGDFNGDGYADLAVGSRSSSHVGSNTGLVAVFSGPITADIDAEEGYDFATYGSTSGTYLGASFDDMRAADIDGDGPAELIIGVSYNDDASTNAGAIFLHYGPLSGQHSTRTFGRGIFGPSATDYLGRGITIGDVDSDGTPDLIGGAYRANTTGAVYIFTNAQF